MPEMGFETTTPAFKRAKTVNALDRAATVIGSKDNYTTGIETGQQTFQLLNS
jgi:hypothetical protein